MKQFLSHSLTCLLGFSVFLLGCVKKEVDLNNIQGNWNPTVAASLVNSTMTAGDIITNTSAKGTFQINSDNSCSILYSGHLYSVMAKDLIVLPIQNIAQTITLTQPEIQLLNSPLATVGVPITLPVQTQTFTFNPGVNGPQIDSVIFKSGLLTDSFASALPLDISCLITIPAAKDATGKSFSKTISNNYSGSGNQIVVSQVPLGGYHFDMSEGGTTNNQFIINYTLTITPLGKTVNTGNSTITVSQSFKNMLFDKFYGYVGQQSLSTVAQSADTVSLAIFKNSYLIKSINLTNPSVKFYISNSFGVPVQGSFPTLAGYTPPANKITVTGSGVPSNINVDYPTLAQIGQIRVDSFSLDNTNSNILNVISAQPQYFLYQFTTLSNPAGVTHNNFVIDTSRINLDMTIKIPLVGSATGLKLVDTINGFTANINQSANGTQITSVDLRTTISNGFPMDMKVQVYFTDSVFHVIDSLFTTQYAIPAATIVPNTFAGSYPNSYAAVTPNTATTDVFFNNQRVTNLNKARKVLVVGNLNTAKYQNAMQPVQIYANNKVSVNIGVKAVATVPLHQ